MDYIKQAEIPPQKKEELTPEMELVDKLSELIGYPFPLTGKTRTDGNKFRKLITELLMKKCPPKPAFHNDYAILPPKKKGVPKFLREYIDTYIVTSGATYNLQVWNRNPSSDFIQVDYLNSDDGLLANEVRFIFGKINLINETIDSIIILTPDYIVKHFGKFGKPTIKQQLIIAPSTRDEIFNSEQKCIFYPDDQSLYSHLDYTLSEPLGFLTDPPFNKVLPLTYIQEKVSCLIGKQLKNSSTKLKGQELERMIATLLGYSPTDSLYGSYPDIPNQMLEIKVQDSPTVDFGKYSPQFLESINSVFNTENIRYLIALTNPETNIIEGMYLGPGNKLGDHFTFVSDTSFKSQRSIPMNFFESFKGQVIFNPVIE